MPRILLIAVTMFAASHAVGREIPLSEIVSTVHQTRLPSPTGIQYIGSGRRSVDGKLVEEDYA